MTRVDSNLFWQEMKLELADIPSQFKKKKHPSTIAGADCFELSFQSLLYETIYGMLLIPKTTLPCPIVIDFLGYMNHIETPNQFSHWLKAGYACLVIDNRGQGGKTQDTAPYKTIDLGVPMGKGFLSNEDFYMRRLVADNLRAVTLAAQLPEIDQKAIFLRGGSQGGGVALLVNALTEQPIKATFADVPSHSNLSRRIDEGTGSYGVIHDYIQKHPETKTHIKQQLAVFDTQYLVSTIQNPVYASVGSADPICPMTDFFPTYHKLRSYKQLLIYWKKGHGGGEHRQLLKEVQKIAEEIKGEPTRENCNL